MQLFYPRLFGGLVRVNFVEIEEDYNKVLQEFRYDNRAYDSFFW